MLNGHLAVAQWLHDIFVYNYNDVATGEYNIVNRYSYNNSINGQDHLAMVKWLYVTFHLTAQDVNKWDDTYLRERGFINRPLLEWLQTI